jgi:type I restriction enzyme S subunit
MGSSTRYKLSDVIDIIGGGTPKRSVDEFWGGAIPWLSVVDFNNSNRFVSNTVEKITELGLNKSSTKLLPKGALIISARGTVGCLSQLKQPMAFNQSCYGLNAKTDILDNDYLYYLVKHKVSDLQKKTHGSVFDTITRDTFEHILVDIPDNESERNVISKTLGDLDKKIETNLQTNQTLEQMAQALFKSWFVDFDPVFDNALAKGVAVNDFPEALQKKALARQQQRQQEPSAGKEQQQIANGEPSADKKVDAKPLPEDILQLFPSEFEQTDEPSIGINGWIPKGWQGSTIHDMVETISDTYKLKEVDEVIFLNTGDIENGKFLHSEYSPTEGLPGQAKKSIAKGDILYSEIRPKNKRFAFVNFDAGDYVVSTKLMVLRAKEGISSLLPYFILTQDKVVNELQHVAEHRSGTFPQITFKELQKIQMVFPESSELQDYFVEQHLKPIFNKRLASIEQNEQLEKLRDTLLPKLISGEITINKEVV